MTDLVAHLNPQVEVFAHEHLTHLMKVQGVTTTELGTRCDRSAFTVKLYAEGRVDPPASVVGAMAFALRVPVGDLFRPARAHEVEIVAIATPRRIRKT